MAKLILASQSPGRQKMLRELGLTFDVMPADIDETPLPREHPKKYVERVCLEKAKAISKNNPDSIVLAGDTICTLGRRIIGKPKDKKDAAEILRLMSGKRQKVYTAICTIDDTGKVRSYLSENKLKIVSLREKDIQKYVDVEENWKGKAGGFTLSMSTGGSMVEWINGSPSAILGLPLSKAVNLLRSSGYDI
jgi:septum formation protein